jgi:flagellar basal-body rod protein FlgC
VDFLSALNVSASALSTERVRVNLAASNLANAETTRGPDGKPYKRLDPVLEAVPFEDSLAGAGAAGLPTGVSGVRRGPDEKCTARPTRTPIRTAMSPCPT